MSENNLNHCLSCNRSENESPLVTLTYSRKQMFICTICLPILIHHPETLIGKIEETENILPAEHND